jgi:hypothetical protein
MTAHVLDTDHLTLYRHGQAAVVRRVESVPADQLAIAKADAGCAKPPEHVMVAKP